VQHKRRLWYHFILNEKKMYREGAGGGGRGWVGIKVYPPFKIFAKLVYKNAIKHQKGVPSPQNFHNPYLPSLPKFGKNLTDPSPGFSNRVHLWVNLVSNNHSWDLKKWLFDRGSLLKMRCAISNSKMSNFHKLNNSNSTFLNSTNFKLEIVRLD
jgi:hypothetical protein